MTILLSILLFLDQCPLPAVGMLMENDYRGNSDERIVQREKAKVLYRAINPSLIMQHDGHGDVTSFYRFRK